MKLIIFASRSDECLGLFRDACEKYGVEFESIYFDELSAVNGVLYLGEESLKINDEKIIIRWPWNAFALQENYNVYVKELLKYKKNVLLDYDCLFQLSPFYEDKLFQSFVFKELNLPTPMTKHFSRVEEIKNNISYPAIFKKRVASRWRNNFVVKSEKKVMSAMQEKYIGDYVIQEFLDIKRDLRVMVYRDKIIAIAEKDVVKEGEGVIRVKYKKGVESLDENVLTNCLRVCEYLGTDLAGVDLIETSSGEYKFLEVNLSPQFTALKKRTGIDVAEIVISSFFSKNEGE